MNKRLSEREAHLYEEWIANDRTVRALLAEMRTLAAKAQTIILAEAAAEPARRVQTPLHLKAAPQPPPSRLKRLKHSTNRLSGPAKAPSYACFRSRLTRRQPEEVGVSEFVEYKNLIGGQMKGAASGRLLDTVNPATGEVWAKVPLSDHADVGEAVATAKAAFPAWSTLSPDERSAYLKKVGNLFIEHADELARLESTDNGNPLSISKMVFDDMKVLWDRKAHETLEASTGRTVPLGKTTLGMTIREPYGVIAAIVPFNMPVAMLSNKIASALAAGNTVVAKPPEQAGVGVPSLRRAAERHPSPGHRQHRVRPR